MPVTHGWTGGQYSLLRAAAGLYLLIHFASVVPWAGQMYGAGSAAASVAGTGVSLLLIAGWHDRAAALALWALLAFFGFRNPLASHAALPFVGWLLLAHACLPPAPYGSVSARGRADPAGGWQLPGAIHGAAWLVLMVAYAYSGAVRLFSPSWIDGTALEKVLQHPMARTGWIRDLLLQAPPAVLQTATWLVLALQVAFLPLGAFAALRRLFWMALVWMHVAALAVLDAAPVTFGMLLIHWFTFRPAWVRPLFPGETATLFYDGRCALCHAAVRFVLAEDTGGSFRFAPLDGPTFRATVPETLRQALPDSLVVRRPEGALLTRSAAALYVARRLGGTWRLLAWVLEFVPPRLRDAAYDGVARQRRRLGSPRSDCPVAPDHLRARFDP